MDFDDVIRTRRSVHQYADDDIDDETLAELFEEVRYAPSSFNFQPWEFLVLRDDEELARLQSVAYGQEHVTDAAAAVAVLGTLDPTDHAERVASDLLEKGYLPNEEAYESQLDSAERLADSDRENRRVWTVQPTFSTLVEPRLLFRSELCPSPQSNRRMINSQVQTGENGLIVS